jgi:DALR anticodon binding domain
MNTVNNWKFQELALKSLLIDRLQSAIAIVNQAVSGGQDAQPLIPTIKSILCGTGILPVADNGARSQFKLTSNTCYPEIPLNRAKHDTRLLYVSAIALKLANIWQQPPQAIATQLVENLEPLCNGDFAIEVTPLGMIQFELTDVGLANWLQRLTQTPLALPESGILCNVVTADRLFPIQYSHARCCSLLRMANRDRIMEIVEFDATRACFQTFRSDSDPPKSPLTRGTLSEFSPLFKGDWGGSPGLKTRPATPQIWSLKVPNPIPWLDENGRSRLVHPAEHNLISQLLAAIDSLAPIIEQYNDVKPVNYFKLANNLSAAFQNFYSQCRIWGEVKIETPKLAQSRLGLVLATQSLLRFILEELLNAVAPLEL